MGPCEGKEPLVLDLLHDRLPFDVLVAGMSNLAARNLTLNERAVEFHVKPLAEFTVIRERAPDPRNGSLEFDALLDVVVHCTQPLGCTLAKLSRKGNLVVALYAKGHQAAATGTNSMPAKTHQGITPTSTIPRVRRL